ncbi:MAG: hypothetical protein PHW02_09060 [bacterium]|nr:hypothetical protein [bacterium]
MNQYLSFEIESSKDFIKEADIAKFIIQSFTGPFHLQKEKPLLSVISERIREEYRSKHEFNRQREIYQQISEKFLRIHIIPFLRKYRSVNLLSNLFMENYEFFLPEYLDPISPAKCDSILSGYQSFNGNAVISLVNTFNMYRDVPHHSESYRDNLHPAYVIVLNDVIKKYMRVL